MWYCHVVFDSDRYTESTNVIKYVVNTQNMSLMFLVKPRPWPAQKAFKIFNLSPAQIHINYCDTWIVNQQGKI